MKITVEIPTALRRFTDGIPSIECNSATLPDLLNEIGQRFPAISKHLRLLRRAHLVREQRQGRHRVYQLNPEPLRAVDSWIDQYRSFWATSLNNLKAFVEAEHAREANSAPRKPR